VKPGNPSPLQQYVSKSSFIRPAFFPPLSAWVGHGPFAFWLVESLKPDTIVELGAHYGYSYFCFCQQAAALKLNTKCFAVDTWKGDEHAGFYDESVFNLVSKINAEKYAGFSTLVRSTFDEAAGDFAEGSIDLLHIDGRHRYEDVKHDFETWRPKLSNKSVVLFHDTQVRHGDFGVFRFWSEISREYPHFEFTHYFGLGVLGFGKDIRPDLRPLFEAAGDAGLTAAIRASYEQLGMVFAGKHISRTAKCPCGSGERYKHCCGSFATAQAS
jgi:methyltransferase family protein/SEC-C motif-containing protein